jgi:hypothetical protein
MTSNDDKPQLARPCYTVDSAEDDDNSASSLEILPPIQKAPVDGPRSQLSVEQPAGLSLDDDSSDDELLRRHKGPTFARTFVVNHNSTKCTTVATPMPSSCHPSITTDTTRLPTLSTGGRPQASTTASRKRTRTRSTPDPTSHPNSPSHREAERARQKVEAERRKRQTALARQLIQREKQLQKEAEKVARKTQRTETQQASGRFAKHEIVVLLDPIMYRTNDFGLVTIAENLKYVVKEFPTDFSCKKTIQWIRREQLMGGAEQAWKLFSEGKRAQIHHVPNLVVVMEYQDYIPLIQCSQPTEQDLDDDYPKLESWLADLKHQWHEEWKTTPSEPHITLILHQVAETLDKQWNIRRGRETREAPIPSDWDLRDSLQWLLVQFRVDCIQCISMDEVRDAILNFTRGLSEAPYVNQATELECVRKIKPGPDVAEDDNYSKANDTWFRQLRMIPQVSEQRARSLVEHYPTLQSLWQAYRNGNEASNMDLLSGCFGSQNSQSNLSATLYTVMTSNDPKAIV